METIIDDYLASLLTPPPILEDSDVKVLKAIAENPTLADAAESLNLDLTQFLEKINVLKRKNILPKTRNYRALRRRAKILLYKLLFEKRTSEVLNKLEEAINEIRSLRNLEK